MFSFFILASAAASAAYASKKICDDDVAAIKSGEKNPLLLKSKKKDRLPSAPSENSKNPAEAEENPFINQIKNLLADNEFKIAYKVIQLELSKKENTLQDINKIIEYIDKTKQKARDNNKMLGLSLFGQPSIIPYFDALQREAQDKLDKLRKGSAYSATQN